MNDKSLLSGAKLFELSPLHVDEGNRIGFLHEDKAAALGRLMAVDGQRDPIKVVAQPKNADQPWRLVTGMHRLIGARIEGITVWAIEVTGKPEDLADLEASENLHRRPLAPIERAKFTAALVMAAQKRIARQHGNLSHQQRGAKARWDAVRKGEVHTEQALKDETDDACAKIAQAYSWEESVGDALGMSRRAIYNDLTLYRLLIEPFPTDLVEALAAHPVVGENASQLKAIAGIRDEGQRRAVIELILSDPELSADEAKVRHGIGSADNSAAPRRELEKYRNQIKGGWQRLSFGERRAFIPDLAGMLHTADLKREMRDRLNKDLGEQAAGAATGALKSAFAVLRTLRDGEGVDDEAIMAAAKAVQGALFGIEEQSDAR